MFGAAAVAFALLGGVAPAPTLCSDPLAHLRCPDIRMARPSDLWIQHTRRGRVLLHATSSLNVRGTGPLDVVGRRFSRYSMQAYQVIHRLGRPVYHRRIRGGRVVFKPIPGQGGYWKFRNAARFELWTVGPRMRQVRTGRKLIYCLRDLRRTHPGPLSPRARVHPGCNQSLRTARVHLGTSVGWSDIYPSTYHEQYIDVTGLRGCFGLWMVADPYNELWESNEADNASGAVVRLPRLKSGGGC
jgi:hypothetical protein